MALRGTAVAAFVIPIVFSFVFGGSVLSLALSNAPGSIVPQSSGSISITGITDDYTAPVNVVAQISVSDPAYDCGDLYLTVFDVSVSPKKSIGQHAFFDQCYGTSGTIPLNEEFAQKIEKPGQYLLVAQLFDKDGNKFLTAEKNLTVK
ncbi:MAG: hypothetical protein EPO62_08210 [Candidatus Nitrosotenuis sp.]|nr:MAG: hypothetical protein EPO62_08210 [Candidatus Nitrosotenuis sp.]